MVNRMLDPALLGLLLILVGLVGSARNQPRRSLPWWKIAAWSGFIFLWLCASPWFSNTLMRVLQPLPTDLTVALAGTDPSERALVVLAQGSRNWYDFVPPVERLDDTTLARLLGGARIYREQGGFGLVIVTGPGRSFVESMADYLVWLGVPRDRIALESEATDTSTNAIYSAEILKKYAVQKTVLVTSALHIPRATRAFERVGLEVVAAPVDYMPQGWPLLPSSAAMHRTSKALHEMLGQLKP